MSFVGLIINGLFIVLLLVVLGYGVLLNRRLKAIREGQTAFAATIRALDESTRRAEASLASLKGAAAEAHEELHDRILRARELKTELEALTARGERLTQSLGAARPAPAPPMTAPSQPLRPGGWDAALHVAQPEAPANPGYPHDRRVTPERRAPERRTAARALDDDLFEAPQRPRPPGDFR